MRTTAHADGGAVMFVDVGADLAMAERLEIEASLDRLGVCNRLNLLLVHRSLWDEMLPRIHRLGARMGISLSLPPHPHPLGHEWALDSGCEATVTVAAKPTRPRAAAALANEETFGPGRGHRHPGPGRTAAGVPRRVRRHRRVLEFQHAPAGRFRAVRRVPETGISTIDAVPGPRGPVTFRDLYLRQFVVTPVAP